MFNDIAEQSIMTKPLIGVDMHPPTLTAVKKWAWTGQQLHFRG